MTEEQMRFPKCAPPELTEQQKSVAAAVESERYQRAIVTEELGYIIERLEQDAALFEGLLGEALELIDEVRDEHSVCWSCHRRIDKGHTPDCLTMRIERALGKACPTPTKTN